MTDATSRMAYAPGERWFDVDWCGEFIGNTDHVCALRAGHAEPCENEVYPPRKVRVW